VNEKKSSDECADFDNTCFTTDLFRDNIRQLDSIVAASVLLMLIVLTAKLKVS
jgi:hypothetical protein